jgi:colanic acid biosynthesis protein WcaH
MLNKKYLHVPRDMYKDYLRFFPVPTVDVLFFNPKMKKTLLFKRNNNPLKGGYFSVGGRIVKGESMIAAAVRKTKEETGLSLERKKLFFGGVQDEIHSTSIFPLIGYHSVDIYFGYILSEEKKISFDSQHSSAKWFSINDPTLHPYIKSKIRRLVAAYDKTH